MEVIAIGYITLCIIATTYIVILLRKIGRLETALEYWKAYSHQQDLKIWKEAPASDAPNYYQQLKDWEKKWQ